MKIILKNELISVIIESKGAELKSFKDAKGREYMWQGDPKYWGKTSPILFPLVGNLRNDKTIINGKEYNLSKHGFARDMEFNVLEQTKTSATFAISHTEQTLQRFPFKYRLELTYILEEDKLKVQYKVYNLDTGTMPYFIGAHPAFNCPFDGQGEFSDYVLEFEEREIANTPMYDLEELVFKNENRVARLDNERELKLNYDLFDDDALVFDTLQSKRIALLNSKTRKGVEVAFTGFEIVGIWTPIKKEAPFVCIEPWCGAATYNDEDDEFIHKRCVQLLEVGEQRQYSLTIKPIQ